MANLIYSAITSLDGYIEDPDARFDWAQPSDEVHAFINDLERPIGTYLFGRRMYETMAAWETEPSLAESDLGRDYAQIWQATEKVVYSTTLQTPSTTRTRIERDFDPEAVRWLKESAASDLGIGGAEIAAHAFRAGLVDVCHPYVVPIIVGGGKPALPSDVRILLDLLEARRFADGTVHLAYRTRG